MSPPILQALKITSKFHLYVTLVSHLDFLPVLEWTRSRSKAVILTLIGCTFSMGQMMMGGLAFVFREWRTLQLVVSAPFFVFFLSSRYEHLSHSVLWEPGMKMHIELRYIDFLIPQTIFLLFGPKTHVSHLFTLWDSRSEKQNAE